MRGDFGSARLRHAAERSETATANNPYVAIILLRAGQPNDQATALLRDAVAASGLDESMLILNPEVRGADFFSNAESQLEVDYWWKTNVPPDAFPLYVVDDETAVTDWLDSVDGHFFICERGESTTDVVNEGDNVTLISGSPDGDALTSAVWNLCFPGTSLPRRAPKRAPRARAGARSKGAFQRARLGDGEELAPLKRNKTKAAAASEAFFQSDEDKKDMNSYAEITETAEMAAVDASAARTSEVSASPAVVRAPEVPVNASPTAVVRIAPPVAVAHGALPIVTATDIHPAVVATAEPPKAPHNFASELISVLGDTILRLQRMADGERVPA